MAQSAIPLLNQILKVEYGMILHYPRLMTVIWDEETKHLASMLGTASVKHADLVAKTILSLGGTPEWAVEPFPGDEDLQKIFEAQLLKEEDAHKLHTEASEIVSIDLAAEFMAVAKEEQAHARTVRQILDRLAQIGNRPREVPKSRFF